MAELDLLPLDRGNRQERQAFLDFVRQNYESPIALEDASLDRIQFFWAKRKADGETIGVTGYYAKTAFLAETVKTIVAARFRGQGFGPFLSKAVEDEVRRRGFKKVMTTIYVTNLPMIFIKLKQGYRFEGFHPDHEKPGLHEYSFGKVF